MADENIIKNLTIIKLNGRPREEMEAYSKPLQNELSRALSPINRPVLGIHGVCQTLPPIIG